MKRLYLVLAAGLFLVHLTAHSASSRNLKTDMEMLDLVFAGKQNPGLLDIEFTIPPWIVSTSSELAVQGIIIRHSESLNTKPIGFEIADRVFSKLFNQVEIVEIDLPQKDGRYLLKLECESSLNNVYNGEHVAVVVAEFYGLDKSLLLEGRVRHVIKSGGAQAEPMQRVYLRAFNEIAWRIRDKLQGAADTDNAEIRAELMRSAKKKRVRRRGGSSKVQAADE